MNRFSSRHWLVPGVFCAALIAGCGGAVTDTSTVLPAAKSLKLQGETEHIQTGLIEVTAGKQVWKGNIESGRFALDITPTDSEVVLVKALGTGQQARIVLASLLGTGAEITAQAGDSILEASDTSTLKLNTLTTAEYGQLPTAELTSANVTGARRSINLLEAYQVATALQVLADDPAQAMPRGMDDTLQLAQSSLVRMAFVQSIRSTAAYELASRKVGGAPGKAASVSEASLLGTVTLLSQTQLDAVVTFKAGGTVDVVLRNPSTKADESANAIDSDGNYVGGFTASSNADTGTWTQIDDDSVRIVLDKGIRQDGSFDQQTGAECSYTIANGESRPCYSRQTYRAFEINFKRGAFGRYVGTVYVDIESSKPMAQNEQPQSSTIFDNFALITLPGGHYKFSTNELAGRTTLLSVYDETNAGTDAFFGRDGSAGGPSPALSAELVRLNADGTGDVPRLAGVRLTWALEDDSRALKVSYSNGDTAVYRKASREKPQPYSFNGSAFDGDALNSLRDFFNVLGFGAQEFIVESQHSNASPALVFAARDLFTSASSPTRYDSNDIAGRYNSFGLGSEAFGDEPSNIFGDQIFDLFADGTGRSGNARICDFSTRFNGGSPECRFDGQIYYVFSTYPVFWQVNADGQLIRDRRSLFDADNRSISLQQNPNSRRCQPLGDPDGDGLTCKVVDRRIDTLLKQHGSRYVNQTAFFANSFMPIDGIKPRYVSQFFDRTQLPAN